MESPKKRWKIDDNNKDLFARELAFNTIINKLNTGESTMKNILTNEVIDANKTIDELKILYRDALGTDNIYDVNKILNTVFYGFKTTEDATPQSYSRNFDDKIFFMLHFRHYFRILRRLVYFSYIQQGMIEECTRFDLQKYKILHKYYGYRLSQEVSDRIARGMNLDDYIQYYKNDPFKIRPVDSSELETEPGETGTELFVEEEIV